MHGADCQKPGWVKIWVCVAFVWVCAIGLLIYLAIVRMRTRQRLAISPPRCLKDLCIMLWCTTCALCQVCVPITRCAEGSLTNCTGCCPELARSSVMSKTETWCCNDADRCHHVSDSMGWGHCHSQESHPDMCTSSHPVSFTAILAQNRLGYRLCCPPSCAGASALVLHHVCQSRRRSVQENRTLHKRSAPTTPHLLTATTPPALPKMDV